VFGEPLDPVRLACFVLIWTAIALFSWDMLRRRQRARSLNSRQSLTPSPCLVIARGEAPRQSRATRVGF
jgi:hypothetical protein